MRGPSGPGGFAAEASSEQQVLQKTIDDNAPDPRIKESLAKCCFQALVTNLPRSVDALSVWRQDNGRPDLENRIKEPGEQFGIKRLCVDRRIEHGGAKS